MGLENWAPERAAILSHSRDGRGAPNEIPLDVQVLPRMLEGRGVLNYMAGFSLQGFRLSPIEARAAGW